MSDKGCVDVTVPEHAYFDPSSLDNNWRCERGYQTTGDICTAIVVPENGHLATTVYGPGWKCRRGYQQNADACTVLNLPEKSHLNFSGNDWECDKPYRKEQLKCVIP